MPYYRVYFVGPGRQFTGVQLVAAADDMDAIGKARQLADSHDVELWGGERLIARFPHEPRKPTA
jgi:hypothetical protein